MVVLKDMDRSELWDEKHTRKFGEVLKVLVAEAVGSY